MIDKLDAALSFNREALNLRAQRQEVLAANIAHADTPNYKARDFDFASRLTQAVEQVRLDFVAFDRFEVVLGNHALAQLLEIGAALQRAAELGLAVSGGSDFHGDVGRRAGQIGRVTISDAELAALESRRP